MSEVGGKRTGPGFDAMGRPVRTLAQRSTPMSKRSRNVALSIAGGIGLFSAYNLLQQTPCEKPTDFATAEAKKGAPLTLEEREALVQQNLADERQCKSRRSGGMATRRFGRSWFGRSGSGGATTAWGAPASSRSAVTRGGFGRSGFSFGG
jgi:hypothetical protein